MIDLADAYVAVQERIIGVVELAGAEGLATVVPASPEWTVKDVVAHVAGLASEAVAGTVAPIDPLEQWRDTSAVTAMTGHQVAVRRDRSIDAVISEWRGTMETMVPMLRGETPFPGAAPFGAGVVFVSDVTVHEQDVRAALGLGRPPMGDALAIALAGFCFALDYRIRACGLGALALHYDGKAKQAGEGKVAATLEADRYELVRAMAGRRNRAQLQAMRWEGDPEPYLPIISNYGERIDALTD